MAQHADRDQHADQIGDDGQRGLNAALRTLDERLIDVDLASQSADQESHDDRQQQQVTDQLRYLCNLLFAQVLAQIPDHPGNQRREATEPRDDHAVKQVDALTDRDGYQTDNSGDKGGDHARDEDVRGVACTQHGSLRHDGERNQREPGCVQHHEHDLGIARFIRLRIDALQRFHRFQTERRGGVVEAKKIRRKVHHHVPGSGMILRHLRKDAGEERRNQLRHEGDRASFLTHVEDAEPECHHTRQRQCNVHHAYLRGLEGAIDHPLEYGGVAKCEPLHQCGSEANEEESGPEIGERHTVKSELGTRTLFAQALPAGRHCHRIVSEGEPACVRQKSEMMCNRHHCASTTMIKTVHESA